MPILVAKECRLDGRSSQKSPFNSLAVRGRSDDLLLLRDPARATSCLLSRRRRGRAGGSRMSALLLRDVARCRQKKGKSSTRPLPVLKLARCTGYAGLLAGVKTQASAAVVVSNFDALSLIAAKLTSTFSLSLPPNSNRTKRAVGLREKEGARVLSQIHHRPRQAHPRYTNHEYM
jgi:hypothetical protein